MDPESRSDEPRDRALSSEPSSTRPNPFDDGDLSARKRRRTSRSGTRSLSVEPPLSHRPPASDSAAHDMKLDTPEPVPPSTPRGSSPAPEPVSSKVTINLRNADADAITASPPSPTPLPPKGSHIQASVEDVEIIDVIPSQSTDDVPSSPSVPNSPEQPAMSVEDLEQEAVSRFQPEDNARTVSLVNRVYEFPYRGENEPLMDTATRILKHLRSNSPQVDDSVHHVHDWLSRCLAQAQSEPSATLVRIYQDHKGFWRVLADIYLQYANRLFYCENRRLRRLIIDSGIALARLAALILSIDAHALVTGQFVTESDLDFTCPYYLRSLATFPPREDHDGSLDSHEPRDVFQASLNDSLVACVSLVAEHINKLAQFPRKNLEHLSHCCYFALSIMRDSVQRVKNPVTVPADLLDRAKDNIEEGYLIYTKISTAIDALIDKSISSLSPDIMIGLIQWSTEILKLCFQGNCTQAAAIVNQHHQDHPELLGHFTADAIFLERRIQFACTLIKSSQMQLRVHAASALCDDLVAQWKTFQQQQHHRDGAEEGHFQYLQYLSHYVTNTGIVAYIIGPTCHPEVIIACGNIVGFLAVTKTYSATETNLLWQTLTTTQDPRICKALVKMMGPILHLFPPSEMALLLERFQDLPIDAFSSHTMRELFDNLTELLVKGHPMVPWDVCVRLLRESSVLTARGCIAHPEIYQFASVKIQRLLRQASLDEDGRCTIALSCLADLESLSQTTSGSLQTLYLLTQHPPGLKPFVDRHNLTALLINDFDTALQSAKRMGFANIYSHQVWQARRRLISSIIQTYPSTIGVEQGQRLWDNLVGDKAASQEDRNLAWDDLNIAFARGQPRTQFYSDCLGVFLPRLPPSCYCRGCLAFVRGVILPLTREGDTPAHTLVLDDDDSLKAAGLELLWQIILTAPDQAIADQAITTLVYDIYVNSNIIASYALPRARRVHFSLAQRCLAQLKAAAQKLKGSGDEPAIGDDERMDIVVTDSQSRDQEFQFARSLKVLAMLLKTLRTKAQFSIPELRSLMLPSPDEVHGDLADLKYQSFDNDEQSEVQPLRVGLKNTAASLLASIREATGFDNYRLYHQGRTLVPSEADSYKSLEDLKISSGLILVKKEQDSASSTLRVKPGASPLEMDILTHFQDLWGYLSMEERLAQEIYAFLCTLPADDSILAVFESSKTSYHEVFPLGEPFKSLYAIYALREYLSSRRLKITVPRSAGALGEIQQKGSSDEQDSVAKVISWLVSAVCDADVVDQCSSEGIRVMLAFQIVDSFLLLLKGDVNLLLLDQLLTPAFYERLVALLVMGAKAESSNGGNELVHRCFDALLECCTKSHDFWNLFRTQTATKEMVCNLLLGEDRPIIRKSIAKHISSRTTYTDTSSCVTTVEFAELFWPIVFELLPHAISQSHKCEEVFVLASHLLRKLIDSGSTTFDLIACAEECERFLLSHLGTEDVAHPDIVDHVAYGLISIVHQSIKHITDSAELAHRNLPQFSASRIFTQHLFPLEAGAGVLGPKVIIQASSRNMLYDIVLALTKRNQREMVPILQNLHRLTQPFEPEGPRFYQYDIPQSFDRHSAVRSICGYSGLKNLSNTCYLNSLFTQLFMNLSFRKFMLEAKVEEPSSHQLLHETQVLFASLQNSKRRFIDPQPCVEQIMLGDQPIDIHNQMDVDEFYILLFDRWEAQLTSEAERKALRSIYGGQLVHQIKSKECEHISERIEPFSAIQCDIKGKASLAESLQSYVDGEVMEGDNKYKCTTCDRHVDAVKRACLKELPDNLIFHLKRFDFDLRMLLRNKINDYFAFPHEIDMQPYTVEYLSDSSNSTEPDMFELVGILVHSGTAETGHYYSFTREHPTSSKTPSWVEFNDETVNRWDPLHMENACFGGAENGVMFEKAYSAYMLFYQRSSALRREQESFEAAGSSRRPRTTIPPQLEIQVTRDNWEITQRHNLFDRAHIPFVARVLEIIWARKCSIDHQMENLAMNVALGHLDQIVTRAKDFPDFDRFSSMVIQACHQCSKCSFAFFVYFRQFKEALRMMISRNADVSIRHDIGVSFLFALKKIKASLPEEYGNDLQVGDEVSSTISESDVTVVEATADLLVYLTETFHTRLTSWPEVFGTIVDFAKMGQLESSALLDRDFLRKAIMTVAPAEVYGHQFGKLIANLNKRNATRVVNYEAIIDLIDTLMAIMDGNMGNYVESPFGRLSASLPDELIPFTAEEINLLHQAWDDGLNASVFVDRLVLLNQHHDATDSILRRLIAYNAELDDVVFNTLRRAATGQIMNYPMTPILRAALVYCASSRWSARVSELIMHIAYQCRALQTTEGQSFFEFQRDVLDMPRKTGESKGLIRLQGLRNLPYWVPGLLGYADRGVSLATENLVNERILTHGPNPSFDDTDGGEERSRATIAAAKEIAVNCLEYLKDTYVLHRAQAARDSILPVHQVLRNCEVYFEAHPDTEQELNRVYKEQRLPVLSAMTALTVDEIDDDGSGMFSDSSTATTEHDC
ncbi:hypothetical protein F5Y18DRAFT_387741 [Xylariaceae sp. FL1019]|nr:hypothetical protein F5Y18DRAFT_387741 [Xylariaceae sp. FL1019]